MMHIALSYFPNSTPQDKKGFDFFKAIVLHNNSGAVDVKYGLSTDGTKKWLFSVDSEGRPLQVRYLTAPSSISACKLLYQYVVVRKYRVSDYLVTDRAKDAFENPNGYQCSCKLDTFDNLRSETSIREEFSMK